MKSSKVSIYMNGKYLMTCRNRSEAEATIRRYEREDRYEVEVEGYAFPENGYPEYEIR